MSEGQIDDGERAADREGAAGREDAADGEGGPGDAARVGMLGPSGNEPEVQEVFDRVREARGNVPHMFRTAGRLPRQFLTMYRHFAAVMSGGKLPRKLKELVSVRVSALNGCRY